MVAFIGAFTALFAALIAVAQNDIKRILAYSTLSQLGFMVAALGIGGWVAAIFHLLTHAFFKALLFLGSGSVIHGMEATVGHDSNTAQDIRNMGDLRKYMPITIWLPMRLATWRWRASRRSPASGARMRSWPTRLATDTILSGSC